MNKCFLLNPEKKLARPSWSLSKKLIKTQFIPFNDSRSLAIILGIQFSFKIDKQLATSYRRCCWTMIYQNLWREILNRTRKYKGVRIFVWTRCCTLCVCHTTQQHRSSFVCMSFVKLGHYNG